MSSKRGSRSIQTPFPVSEHKRNRIAIKWIIAAADKRKGSLEDRIASEISAVLDGSSTVLVSKIEMNYLIFKINPICTRMLWRVRVISFLWTEKRDNKMCKEEKFISLHLLIYYFFPFFAGLATSATTLTTIFLCVTTG